ncbi:hypothetical protein BC832DRAFT_590770 [Gaertneriomyces semiglobifer]|nr:hypothetical protein BC832DRAFT_590770 [Gaertneriomyces semiglobifer]
MRGDSSAAAIESFGAIVVMLRKEGIVLGTVRQLTEEERHEFVATGVLPHAIPIDGYKLTEILGCFFLDDTAERVLPLSAMSPAIQRARTTSRLKQNQSWGSLREHAGAAFGNVADSLFKSSSSSAASTTAPVVLSTDLQQSIEQRLQTLFLEAGKLEEAREVAREVRVYDKHDKEIRLRTET